MKHTNSHLWQSTVATLHHLDRIRRRNAQLAWIENIMLVCACFSIFIVIIESELLWTTSINNLHMILKYTLSMLSLLLVIALIARYLILCRTHIETARLPPKTQFFHPSSQLLHLFLCEVLVCGFHIPPHLAQSKVIQQYLESTSAISSLNQLDAFVLLRIYLLGRFLRNLHGFHALSSHAHIIHSFHRVNVASVWFAIQYSFQRYPFLFTVATLILDWILTASSLNLLERGINPTLNSTPDAIWLTIVTIISVGYGEIAPQTMGGKFTIAIGAIVGGTVITCLLRVVLMNVLVLTPQEKIVIDVVQCYQWIRQRQHLACRLIQSIWKASRIQHDPIRQQEEKHNVFVAAEAFRLLRFTQPVHRIPSNRNNNGSTSTLELLSTLQTDIDLQSQSTRVRMKELSHLFRNMAATSLE